MKWCVVLGLVCGVAVAADLVIGAGGDTRMVVVADGEWLSADEWAALPDKQKHISSWHEPGGMRLPYQAALLLRETVDQVTHAELEVVRETEWEAAQRPPAIHIGRTRAVRQALGARIERPNLVRNGFIVQSRPGLLLICGVNDYGTYNAVGHFLERYAGVDWFWPGPLGEEFTPREQIVLDRVDLTFMPEILFMSGLFGGWGARIGEGKPEMVGGGHHLGPKYFHAGREVRPEWFSLVEGERLLPTAKNTVFNWQPCMAGPAALERIVSLTTQKLREAPGTLSVGIGYNDGVWQPCECRFCRAADTGYDREWDAMPFLSNGGRASGRYFQMVSHVATALQEDFRGLVVGGWSYAGTDVPPAGVKRNPHVLMNVIGTKLAWLNPELRTWEEKRMAHWGRLAGQLMTYDYFYQTGFIPVYAPHHFADVARTLAGLGVHYEYAETYQMMALAGPQYWVYVKLCQDPSQDIDYLLDRWLDGMFHEAAEPMSRFYTTIEDAWVDYPYHGRHATQWTAYCFVGGATLPVLSPTHMQTLDVALTEAEAAATTPRVRERLAAVRAGFPLTRERARLLWKQRPLVDPVPYELAEIRDDWQGHLENRPFFNPKSCYEKNCVPLIDAELFTARTLRTIEDHWDDAPGRLSRVAIGLLAEGLSPAELDVEAPEEARAMLADLVARGIEIPRRPSPTLDGEFEDACWQDLPEHANLLGEALTWGAPAVPFPPALAHTAFRICHDSQAFYLAIDCAPAPGDGKDDIEIDLAPFAETSHGVTVTVSATGEVSENGTGYGSKYWHAGSRAAVGQYGQNGRLEVAIPFRALLLDAVADNRVLFNLRRQRAGAAWYPLPLDIGRGQGGVVCRLTDVDPEAVAHTDGLAAMRPLNATPVSRPITEGSFTQYVLTQPATVQWGLPTTLSGGAQVLIGDELLDILPGVPADIEVIYEGTGACVPELGFYRRTPDGALDVLSGFRFSGVEEEERDGRRVARVHMDWPPEARRREGLADTARWRLRVEGEARVWAMRLLPQPPLGVELRIDSGGQLLRTGHLLTLVATVTNRTDTSIEDLSVDISSVDGVDRRARGLTAATSLAPGESTTTIWWYVPIYAVGKVRFNVVVSAAGQPQAIYRMYGPEL